jgi:hypothetical protein
MRACTAFSQLPIHNTSHDVSARLNAENGIGEGDITSGFVIERFDGNFHRSYSPFFSSAASA